MTTRVASIRPTCRLAFAQAQDARGELRAYHRYLLDLVGTAAACQPHAVCLPEDCMMMMQANHTESVNGEFMRGFGEAAARHKAILIVGMVLEDTGRRYNAAVIFDSNGKYLDRYDKTHLTQLEIEQYGISPGDRLPVFDTEIGRVGVLTCADILFPEVSRILALKGARIAFFPHQMAEPDEEFFNVMVRSRAQDNCLPIICCNFAIQTGRDWYRNLIIGANGSVLTEGPLAEGYALADLVLDAPVPLRDYIEPGEIDLREIILKYRRPVLYQEISHSDTHSD